MLAHRPTEYGDTCSGLRAQTIAELVRTEQRQHWCECDFRRRRQTTRGVVPGGRVSLMVLACGRLAIGQLRALVSHPAGPQEESAPTWAGSSLARRPSLRESFQTKRLLLDLSHQRSGELRRSVSAAAPQYRTSSGGELVQVGVTDCQTRRQSALGGGAGPRASAMPVEPARASPAGWPLARPFVRRHQIESACKRNETPALGGRASALIARGSEPAVSSSSFDVLLRSSPNRARLTVRSTCCLARRRPGRPVRPERAQALRT
jgi:hypothetical protein